MSHDPPPPPNNFFGLDNVDIVPLQDTTSSQGLTAPNSIADAFSVGAAGSSSNDIMALIDSGMFDGLGGDMVMPMSLSMDMGMDASPAMAGTGDVDVSVNEDSIVKSENMFNTAANNVPGAGPMPPDSFSMVNLSNSNTVTEFTKRRNWPAKVVEELKDLLQILDANGRIKFVSPSVESLTGYTAEELKDVFLKDLIHPDDQGVFVAELNESIASGNQMRMFYRVKKKDETYAIFESVGHAHIAPAKFAPNPSNQSPFCQAVFMMARLYPTRNAALLDSFLEHKIENERLKRRIAELRREEDNELDESQKQWMQSQEGRSDIAPSEGTGVSASTAFYGGASERSMTVGDQNDGLTRANLEGVVAGNRPDSIRDKMARYEGSSHTDTIEMLTGLRYLEGERSRGITTGNKSPTLIQGAARLAVPGDPDSRAGDKKKKLKTSEEYVCTDCGTLDSPEWRKGPNGPKTLCNACGLRWAKKEKKRNTNPRNQ